MRRFWLKIYVVQLSFIFVTTAFAKEITSGKQDSLKDDSLTVITTKTGSLYKGSILYVTNNMLVFWNNADPYKKAKLDTFAVALSYKNIDQVSIKRKKENRWTGIGIGFLVGAGVGVISGFASGNDQEGFLSFSAEDKALRGGMILGAVGALIGGIVSRSQKTDGAIIISGKFENYKRIQYVLKEDAIFTTNPPLEILNFIEISENRSDKGKVTNDIFE